MNGILKFSREKRVGSKNSRLKEQLVQKQEDKNNHACSGTVKNPVFLKPGVNEEGRRREVSEGM